MPPLRFNPSYAPVYIYVYICTYTPLMYSQYVETICHCVLLTDNWIQVVWYNALNHVSTTPHMYNYTLRDCTELSIQNNISCSIALNCWVTVLLIELQNYLILSYTLILMYIDLLYLKRKKKHITVNLCTWMFFTTQSDIMYIQLSIRLICLQSYSYAPCS